MVPVSNHTDKEARDTALLSQSITILPADAPSGHTSGDLEEALLLSLVVYFSAHGVFHWHTFSKIFFVCKQWSHLNAKQPLENKHFFMLHLKVKEFPSNLALPEV